MFNFVFFCVFLLFFCPVRNRQVLFSWCHCKTHEPTGRQEASKRRSERLDTRTVPLVPWRSRRGLRETTKAHLRCHKIRLGAPKRQKQRVPSKWQWNQVRQTSTELHWGTSLPSSRSFYESGPENDAPNGTTSTQLCPLEHPLRACLRGVNPTLSQSLRFYNKNVQGWERLGFPPPKQASQGPPKSKTATKCSSVWYQF